MKEFICTGTLTLNGVTFIIEADNLTSAKQKVVSGEWKGYEIGGAEAKDWELDPRTIESND